MGICLVHWYVQSNEAHHLSYYYYYIICSLITGFLSSLVLLLLSQWWTPPLRLQVSACSTFLMMCDVPNIAVFCRESIDCCPGIVSRYFVNFYLQFRWSQWLLVWHSILCSTFSEFLYLDFYTLISSQPSIVLHFYQMVLVHQSIRRFCTSCL
jgi:hypothetical protein